MHKINATTRGKGSGDAWGSSVRDQLSGSPDATRLDLMDREEKRENQAYWKARIGYGHRWIVESVFSAFKRLFGEHLMALKWDNILQEVRPGRSCTTGGGTSRWHGRWEARHRRDGIIAMPPPDGSSAGVCEEN